LVIVAVEMLTGRIGIGNFLWNEYNNGLYTSIVLCIVTIGLVGFALDRAMSLLERRFKSIL
jgi:nitrate/nitrite transport system permease protein